MKSLTASLKDYLAIRRALDYELEETERLLIHFIHFLAEKNEKHITIALALEWAMQAKNVTRAYWSRRLSVVRLFAQYYQTEDQKTQVPPSHLLSQQPCRSHPYIYSDKQISQLLIACQSLSSHGLREHTYFTFFGLMAVTGCRISELLSLDQEDFNKIDGWITIRNSKFNKSRLLPLHPTTLIQLNKYIKLRDQVHPHPLNDAFFLSDQGTRITKWSVRYAFIQLSKQIGLRTPSDSHGPRIHDIRHTFTVKSVLNWYRDDVDVNQKMPLLSAYLGHKKPSDTYWYLTGIPELLSQAAIRLEKQLGE
ncbi:MAG: tyrosine-type recombinase/integrase [Pseudomonadota bacterium]|nr:tyrosine-type recombinase/integrase [Pseudomonadota bacterium]